MTDKKPSSLYTYLIKNGWAHDKASAGKLLVFLSVLIILLSIIIYYLFVVRPANAPIRVNISPEVMNRLPHELQEDIRNSKK